MKPILSFDHQIPACLKKVKKITQGTDFENHIWLVGGAVRDAYLGLPLQDDFDLVTDLESLVLAEVLKQAGASEVVTYPRFGTAMVRFEGADLELVSTRKESYDSNSRKPYVVRGSLLEDAQRRDFTINTLLWNLHQECLEDPLGIGVGDLQNKVLRTPLDPKHTFYEDPLRMLRAIRFRWRFGLIPAKGVYEAIVSQADRLKIISQERIRDEFIKILMHDTASNALQDLLSLGLLDRFAPELVEMKGILQGDQHDKDVWEHSLATLDNLKGECIELKLAGLFHDIGKPICRSEVNEKIRFLGHEIKGSEITQYVLERMRFSGIVTQRVAKLVKGHMRIGQHSTYTDSTVRRLLRDFGNDLELLVRLTLTDAAAHAPGFDAFDIEPFYACLNQVCTENPSKQFESPLDGQEICEILGIAPGPMVGKIKKYLQEKVLEGQLKTGDKVSAKNLIINISEI